MYLTMAAPMVNAPRKKNDAIKPRATYQPAVFSVMNINQSTIMYILLEHVLSACVALHMHPAQGPLYEYYN